MIRVSSVQLKRYQNKLMKIIMLRMKTINKCLLFRMKKMDNRKEDP